MIKHFMIQSKNDILAIVKNTFRIENGRISEKEFNAFERCRFDIFIHSLIDCLYSP